MNILVNGKAREVNAQTLPLVLVELGYGNAVVATALNGQFVPIAAREQMSLHDNDRLEIVAPMQGG